MRRERFRCASGASAGGEALSGNHLPNPIPPRVRRHSSIAQTPAKACVTLEGACTSRSGMAMPVVSYTRLRAGEHRRASCFSRGPATAREGWRPSAHPVPVGHVSERRPKPVVRVFPGTSAGAAPQRGLGPIHAATPAMTALPDPSTPRVQAARERTGAAASGRLCARRDRIQHTQPMVFGQLRPRVDPFAGWPDNPPPTRQERTARYAFTRRGRATLAKGTSLCASQVERFVIERFTPRFLIDIELVGEGVTAGPRDAVDSILKNRGAGEPCETEGKRAGAAGP